MASLRTRNLAIGTAGALFVTFMGLIPYMTRKGMNKSLYNTDDPLTGPQNQRGPYLNSGSKDAGRDPDWDSNANAWRGTPRNK